MHHWQERVFDVNQLAFSIWNFFQVFNLFPLCSVHSSWRDRIWQFQDENAIAVACTNNNGKGKKRKNVRLSKMETLKRIKNLNASSNPNITSSKNQYLHTLRSLTFRRCAFPIPSRFLAFFSACINLQHLTLINIKGKYQSGIGIQNFRLLKTALPHLVTLNMIESAPEKLRVLAEGDGLEILQQLCIVENYYFDGGELLQRILHQYPNLTHFSLVVSNDDDEEYGGINFDELIMSELGDIFALQLRRFYFSVSPLVLFSEENFVCNNITHLGLHILSFEEIRDIQVMFPKLTHLTCYSAFHLTLDIIHKISAVKKLQHLRLDNYCISNNQVIFWLPKLTELSNLTSLSLTKLAQLSFLTSFPLQLQKRLLFLTITQAHDDDAPLRFILTRFLNNCDTLQTFITDKAWYERAAKKMNLQCNVQRYTMDEIWTEQTLLENSRV